MGNQLCIRLILHVSEKYMFVSYKLRFKLNTKLPNQKISIKSLLLIIKLANSIITFAKLHDENILQP